MNIRIKTILIIFFSIPVILHNFYIFDYAKFSLTGIKPSKINLETFPVEKKALLIPLDSRPPCLQFVQQLGDMSGIEIIVPPNNLLDNYMTPANYAELKTWAITNSQQTDVNIVSIDMLLFGGLIASRQNEQPQEEIDNTLETLKTLAGNKNIPLYAFSIIPRLLIPEKDETKLWQYHMMVYATKKDMEDTFGNYKDFSRIQEMLNRVPHELIENANILYQKNDQFNHQLSLLTQQNTFARLDMGQDDGQPFGRPNANRRKVEQYAEHLNLQDKLITTHGADELAMLQLALYMNQIHSFSPKIKVIYNNEQTPDMVMPFMPITVAETVHEKIYAINGQQTDSLENADLVLFVHCGTRKVKDQEMTENVQKIQQLAKQKPVALVDLSYNFRQKETLVETFIKEEVPLSILTAYAGWNTTSNSIGTALAQVSLFLNKKKDVEPEQLPYLYKKNFEFTITRIIDDWLYQKDIKPAVNKYIRWQGINPYRLGDKKEYTMKQINNYIHSKQESLFYKNLAKYPFYTTPTKDYYLTNWSVELSLPWERTFEIAIDLQTTTGIIAKAK